MTEIYLFSALHFVASNSERYVLYNKEGQVIPEFIALEDNDMHQPMLVSQKIEGPADNEFIKHIKYVDESFGFEEAIDKGRLENHKLLDFHSFFVTKIVSSREEFLEYKEQFPDAEEIVAPVSEKSHIQTISKEDVYDFIFEKKAPSKGRNQNYGEPESDLQIEQIKAAKNISVELTTAIENKCYEKYLAQGLDDAIAHAKSAWRKDIFLHNKNGCVTTYTDPFYKSKRFKQVTGVLEFAFSEQKDDVIAIDKDVTENKKPTTLALLKRFLKPTA